MIFEPKKIDVTLARVKIKLLKNSSLDTVFTSSNYSWSFDDDVKSSDLYICLLVPQSKIFATDVILESQKMLCCD